MNKRTDEEYVFWLNSWRSGLALWPKVGQFKCVVTREKICITSAENNPDKELTVSMSSVQKCKLGYDINNRYVELFLIGRKLILGPVHPIDPSGIQNLNYGEAAALMKTINAFLSDIDPEADANPYLRQLATKNNLKGFRAPDIKWDKNTSPWAYYELYGHKHLRIKVLFRNIILSIAMAVIVTAAILGVAYILDILNVI